MKITFWKKDIYPKICDPFKSPFIRARALAGGVLEKYGWLVVLQFHTNLIKQNKYWNIKITFFLLRNITEYFDTFNFFPKISQNI